MSHLALLTAALEKNRASLGLRWRHNAEVSRALVTEEHARSLNVVLKRVSVEERDRLYRGRLVGGSLVRGTFELELDDETIISGRVAEDLLSSVEELFGRECTASVRIRETRLPSGETKENIQLLRLDR